MLKEKNRIRLIPIAFISLIWLSSCSKLSNPEPTPLTSYNLSAYANGEFVTFNASVAHYPDSVISIDGVWLTNLNETYSIHFHGIKITKGYIGTYKIGSLGNGNFSSFYYRAAQTDPPGPDIFFYNSDTISHTGSLSITTYDSINRTISGSFAVSAIWLDGSQTSYPSTLNITNGVFKNLQL